MVKRLTNDEFIKRARNTHGDKYDYSKVEYINAQTKVCINMPCSRRVLAKAESAPTT